MEKQVVEATLVRAWARRNGFQVSGRGRLPQALISAYVASKNEQPISPFDLLAKYLEPRFGDIHDGRRWNDDLRSAADSFLTEELPLSLWAALFPKLPAPDALARRDVASMMIRHRTVQELASGVRDAAISAVPTLSQLLTQLHVRDSWVSDSQQRDTAVWLYGHATAAQFQSLAQRVGGRILVPAGGLSEMQKSFVFPSMLSPSQLLVMWEAVTATVDASRI